MSLAASSVRESFTGFARPMHQMACLRCRIQVPGAEQEHIPQALGHEEADLAGHACSQVAAAG